jgi:hypothetical protein
MTAAAKQGHTRAIEELKLLHACALCGALNASRTCQGYPSTMGISTASYCYPKCQAAPWKAHEPHCGPWQCHRCKNIGRSLFGVDTRRRRNPQYRHALDDPCAVFNCSVFSFQTPAAQMQPDNERTAPIIVLHINNANSAMPS